MTFAFRDRLEPAGIAVGVLLVLVGLGTIVGQPWQYKGGALVMLVELFGALSAIAIGAGLVWLARFEE